MAALRFQSATSSKLKWTTLATALANVSDGAWTCAVLIKRAVDPAASNFDGLAYLLSGAGGTTVEAGMSVDGADALLVDIASQPTSNTGTNPFTVTGTTDTLILVGSKGSGAVRPQYDKYTKATNTWVHNTPTGGSALADQIAATALEIGAWQGGDFVDDAYIGLVAFWEGELTVTQKEELSANWRTSDWWNNSAGAPKFIAELNVAGASVVDLAGNASGLAVTGTALAGAETLASWTFDGIGITPANTGYGDGSYGTGTYGIRAGGVTYQNLAAAVSAAGALSAAGQFRANIASSVSGSGAVSAALQQAFHAASALAGSGTLAAGTPQLGSHLVAGIAGAGGMADALRADALMASAISGAGALSATGQYRAQIAAALSGSGALSASGEYRAALASALSGAGAMLASAEYRAALVAALAGNGALAGDLQTGLIYQALTAALAGAGAMTAAGRWDAALLASLAGSGALAVGTPQLGRHMLLGIAGAGGLADALAAEILMAAAISGNGAMAATGQYRAQIAASLSGTGTPTFNAQYRTALNAAMAGNGSLSAVAQARANLASNILASGTDTYNMVKGAHLAFHVSTSGTLATGSLYAEAKLAAALAGLADFEPTLVLAVPYDHTHAPLAGAVVASDAHGQVVVITASGIVLTYSGGGAVDDPEFFGEVFDPGEDGRADFASAGIESRFTSDGTLT